MVAANRTRTTPAPREANREPAREAGVVLGRDGQPIRRIKASSDWSYIDPSMIPEGYTYQWKMYSVLGDEQTYVGYQADLYRAGWRPVTHDRHPGVFAPLGTTGAIRMRGQQLMERPVELEQEAKAEEKYAADAQVQGSLQQFGLAPTAPGFEGPRQSNNPHVRKNSFVRQSVERVDAPAPKYDVVIE